MSLLITAALWVALSVLALIYALIEYRETDEDRRALSPDIMNGRRTIALRHLRSARTKVAVFFLFLVAGLLALVRPLLEDLFDEELVALLFAQSVRVVLIAGLALLFLDLLDQRRFRKALRRH